MKILLLRPVANERFGLGPFFRIEPLGLEYAAAALEARGHEVELADLRFAPPVERILQRCRPQLVGIASAHTLDTDEALRLAALVKRRDPTTFTLLGGHAAAVYPGPLMRAPVDAICCEDAERVLPELVEALERGRPLTAVHGLHVRSGGNGAAATDPQLEADFVKGPASDERVSLDAVPRPARHLMAPFQEHYLCVNMKPVYLVETARGCRYRCSFCTIWQHVDRSFRMRDIGHVCDDLQAVGDKVFIADDLFWYPRGRSRELAAALARRKIRKRWVLVQTRADLVARNFELLRAWRGFAELFDIFFGFEAPTDEGLGGFSKDSHLADIERAVRVCQELGYGVTGNFIVDPDWEQRDFERLWAFKERLGLHRAGYTILTPLPGTAYFEQARARIVEKDWSKYDMHHVLWEPRLGRQRFFELFAESWKRTVLYAKGVRPWWQYLPTLRPSQIPYFLGVLLRTQRLVDPDAYLDETFPLPGQPPPPARRRIKRALWQVLS